MDEEVKQLSEATDIEEFKSLREAQRTAAAEPAAEKTPQAEEAKPVIAAESGTVETTAQEPVERSTDDQIKELRAKGKHAAANKLMVDSAIKAEKERADALDAELKALRAPKAEAPRTEATATPVAPSRTDDPEPQATDAKYEGEGGYEKYLRDCGRWDARQESRVQESRKQQETVRDSMNRKMTAAKVKYPDFDAATAGDMKAGTGLILSPAMIQFAHESDSLDVVYHLGKNPDEYARIFMLTPARQLAELGKLEDKISGSTAAVQAAPPVVLKPAVSRVAAPPRVLSGNDTPEPKGTSEARDFDEFKRIRKARAS